MENVFELAKNNRIPENAIIFENMMIAESKIRQFDNIMCSVSGGSDSDIMVDILTKVDPDKKIRYVFFDTGAELRCIHEHLTYLEEKYGVRIERIRTLKPVISNVRNYGVPFLSKRVSEMLYRLQHNNFDFKGHGAMEYEELIQLYPHCKSALLWWTNRNRVINISSNKLLKEFLIDNPPDFPISDKCCDHSKKNPSREFVKKNGIQLVCLGLRRAEGGERKNRFHSCFHERKDGVAEYFPVFWYTNETKKEYERFFGIDHAKAYSEYGLARTGCAGCPVSLNVFDEINALAEHEPQMYQFSQSSFGKSYEYRFQYMRYREMKENEM